MTYYVIRPTIHSTARMSERSIRPVWIEATVLTPDWTVLDRGDPTLTHSFKGIAEFGGRILKVVHRVEGADIVIVTAYFDRGAKRP